jgi:hypothetical protein
MGICSFKSVLISTVTGQYLNQHALQQLNIISKLSTLLLTLRAILVTK